MIWNFETNEKNVCFSAGGLMLALAPCVALACDDHTGVVAAVSASVPGPSASAKRGPCGNDLDACLERARDLYQGRDGKSVNAAAAVPLLEVVCDRSGKEACTLLGEAYLIGEPPLNKDRPKAVELFKKGCAKGGAGGCASLGNMYATGAPELKGGRAAALPFYEKSQRLLQKACENGDARQCYTTGLTYEGVDFELKTEPTKAKSLYQKALTLATHGCKQGQAPDCYTLALLQYNGKVEPGNRESVPKLLTTSCDGHVREACTLLGILQRDGQQGLKSDNGKALTRFKQACGGGDPVGCYLAGLMEAETDRVMDVAAAADHYDSGCARREPRACNNLGVMYEHGTSAIVKDSKRALSLYERACTLGNRKGCENEAALEAVQKREETAAPFRKSLAVGSESHCGLVVEVKKPIALVQTLIGQVWLRIDQLYPPGKATCTFHNGQYVDP